MRTAQEYIYEALKNMRFDAAQDDMAFLQDKRGVVITIMPKEQIFNKIGNESN